VERGQPRSFVLDVRIMGNGPRNFHKTIVCLTFPPRSVKRRAAMGSAKSENQKAQRYVKDRSYSNPKVQYG